MIGIIGGTGLYQMDELQVTEVREVTTPFGAPSAPIVLGMLQGRNVAFLARHGLHHDLLPSEVNYRGNIWALKSLGVRTLLGVSAVGSLREQIRPGDLALSSQYLDFTKGLRASTFFGRGLVAHVSTANPTCSITAALVAKAARALELTIHEDKTHAVIEGPRFGTRAESLFLRTSGADLVGMTNVPEVFLAAEAQLGYCTIGVATDYDSWLDDPQHHASAVEVAKLFRGNLERVQQLLANVVVENQEDEARACRNTLKGAIMTPRERMTADQRSLVSFLTV
ncbi:MAG: 5-methylthioadenosine phosphorylase [Gammaproteobacteria bacterium]|jgi:5'-methylthioadenosine phosphorylase|nr:5-methylthioadenosine phosphorylase [Gammaproteobacteria bacterium]